MKIMSKQDIGIIEKYYKYILVGFESVSFPLRYLREIEISAEIRDL